MSLLDVIMDSTVYISLRAERDELAASVDRLTSDKARLASGLAAEQESNTYLNNLHTLDADRIKALEAALRPFAMKMPAWNDTAEDGGKLTVVRQEWIEAALACFPAETLVSTLCAVCDQIKELHPNTHPWTAKTTSETKGE